jgi:hypothetical protein
MKAIPELRRLVCMFYYHWINTSTGCVLIPQGVVHSVVYYQN